MSRLREIVERIRSGDELAAMEFVEIYGPHVRAIVHARMRALRVRGHTGSSDVCQIVLASVIVGSAVGRYQPADSEEMRKLLAKIAVNKVIDLKRRPENRHPTAGLGEPGDSHAVPAERSGGPASEVMLQELIQKADSLLSDREREIAALRKEGLSWAEVGERFEISADAARKTIERAVERIVSALDLRGSVNG